MPDVRTRFSPSPTGYLHIGGARTALFNWLFAKSHKGTFILRIEDTDVLRSTGAATEAILGGLEWLGIDWDEGPYFQSKRLEMYQQSADRLVAEGKAYYCSCVPETLEEKRKIAIASGKKPKYDQTCRNLGLSKTPYTVVRFKSPEYGSTVVNDLIKGPTVFDNTELDDLIIMRCDGMPTYNFAVVIDDISMGITHVIRGDDHLNNTPRQIQLYQALGADFPQFAHVPMILGADRTRLSKRHGATSVLAYKDMGYMPQAMVNYLARLGWSFGDQEIFSKAELIEKFSLNHVGKSAGIFNPDKLLWLNAHYIKEENPSSLAELVALFLRKMDIEVDDMSYLARVIPTLQARSKTLQDMAERAVFYFTDKLTYEEEAVEKFLKPELKGVIASILDQLMRLDCFRQPDIEGVLERICTENNMKFKEVAQPLRIFLTGKTVSPGLFELMEALGQERVIKRLRRGLEVFFS